VPALIWGGDGRTVYLVIVSDTTASAASYSQQHTMDRSIESLDPTVGTNIGDENAHRSNSADLNPLKDANSQSHGKGDSELNTKGMSSTLPLSTMGAIDVNSIALEEISDDSSEESVAVRDVISNAAISHVDFDAKMGKLLEPAPVGFESITGYHTWEIRNLNEMLVEKGRFKGPEFEIGDDVFNLILVCQRRNSLVFSVYLEGHPKNERDNSRLKEAENDTVIDDNTESNTEQEGEAENSVWSFPVQFTFEAWDPENPKYFKTNHTRFRFNQRVTDWGFVQLLDPKNSIDSRFFDSNSVNITVYVRVIDDYTNVLYSDYRGYDSKKFTGYVGIENQGATCYLNSLLQSYFFTKTFRKKVYQIPTQDEIDLHKEPYSEYRRQEKSVSLALQRIFYKLQTSAVAINSLELTDSFGWTTADAFTQHDVQELNRILMDRLENKMKGTEIDGCLSNIFVGKMSSFIRCINVDYESSRTEDFWDIQLNVKGMKTIQDSFANYIELEILSGDNKYDASGYGLQDAEKGVIFESFPDVLHVQLKRYEYDFETDNMVKINDRFEFSDSIDLKPYISKNAENYDEDWEYKLHGVLVHQGDVSVGHYYAMIKPNDEDKWFKFDDDRVSRVTPNTVFEEGFGCGPPGQASRNMSREEYQTYVIKHHTSAYMLVYMRKSKLPALLADVTDVDIPPHIKQQIEYETEQDLKIKKEREEMHFYVNFRVYTDMTFRQYEGFDIGPNYDDNHYYNEDLYSEDSFPISFRLLKTDPWSTIYDTLCELLGKEKSYAEKLRLWNIYKRENRTYRAEIPIEASYKNIDEATVGDVSDALANGTSRRKYSGLERPTLLSLYLEDAANDLKYLVNHMSLVDHVVSHADFSEDTYETKLDELLKVIDSKDDNDAILEPIAGTNNILIFMKYFSPRERTIKSLSHLILPNTATVEFIENLLVSLFQLPENSPIYFGEELDFFNRNPLKPNVTLYEAEISNGDIICADVRAFHSDPDLKALNCESCYKFLESRVHFVISKLERVDEDEEDYIFIDNSAVDVQPHHTIDTWLSYNSSYMDVAKVVSEEIGAPAENIKLSFISNGNKIDLRSDYEFSKLLQNKSKQYKFYLFYEVLNIPLKQFEGMELFHVIWVGNGICKEERHDFFLPKSSSVDQVITKLQSKVDLTDAQKDDIFCWIPDNRNRIRAIPMLDDTVSSNSSLILGVFPQYKEIYTTKNKDLLLVECFQCYGSLENTHGIPFPLDVVRNELVPETLMRLRKLLGLSEKEFKCARIGICGANGVEYLDPQMNDKVELFNLFTKGNYQLVIDHPDRKLRHASLQSSITIKN
jgi:ubiquitin carboxyl-terminal hydrolase 7